jgi:hypothetical protein
MRTPVLYVCYSAHASSMLYVRQPVLCVCELLLTGVICNDVVC